MNQPTGTNGPGEESPEASEASPAEPANAPAPDTSTVAFPLPGDPSSTPAEPPPPSETADPPGTTTVPDEATPDEATPDEAVPDEATPDEAVPDEATPDKATPDKAMEASEPAPTPAAPEPADDHPPSSTPPTGATLAEPTAEPDGAGLADDAAETTAADPTGAGAPQTASTEPATGDDALGDITLPDEDPQAAESTSGGLGPRAGFGTVPLDEVGEGPTPALGTEVVESGWGGAELVEAVYGPLSAFYERLDARLREVPEDVPPVGWAPHIGAMQALREERVAGDWEVLARFLVAPGSLAEAEGLRLVQTQDGDDVVREIVRELAAADGRGLLIAPTPERLAELLRGLENDPDVFSLLIETRPATAEADSVETQGFPPVDDEALEAPPTREPGSHGTVEFRPVVGQHEPQESSAAVTRAERLPVLPDAEPAAPEAGPSAPETRVRSAALRPVGEAWRQSWDTEVRLLRRGLMSLEQWPRDAAALRAAETEHLRRGEGLEAERTTLSNAIEEFRTAAAAAEQGAEQADAEAERLAAVQAEAEEELTGPRAEAERLRTIAEEAAAEANSLTRTADASYARCVQMDERAKTAQAELQAARQAEASLTDELARAREALPAAAEEAHRLTAADADAAAEGHAAYYRLVSAESALAAVRRKMTLGQRLHVASPPPDLKSLRAELKARTRDADEAANRARQAKEEAENAERIRRGLASFVSEGGARLQAAQEAQERLGTELSWLATEREKAGAEHREQARQASESVERATQAGMRARSAQQAAQDIEDRVNAARTSREKSLAAAGRARSHAQTATTRAAEAEAALERRTAEADEEMSAREAELETARRTEARSRENVLEICGADPADDPEVVPAHQRRAMARIEQLTGYLGHGRPAASDVLLRTADLVIGTPAGIGLTARDEEFDALIVADAGEVTDAEFLIGAVRARRWVLVGAAGTRPRTYREYAGAPSGGLEDGPFGRAATAAPHLLDG